MLTLSYNKCLYGVWQLIFNLNIKKNLEFQNQFANDLFFF